MTDAQWNYGKCQYLWIVSLYWSVEELMDSNDLCTVELWKVSVSLDCLTVLVSGRVDG